MLLQETPRDNFCQKGNRYQVDKHDRCVCKFYECIDEVERGSVNMQWGGVGRGQLEDSERGVNMAVHVCLFAGQSSTYVGTEQWRVRRGASVYQNRHYA